MICVNLVRSSFLVRTRRAWSSVCLQKAVEWLWGVWFYGFSWATGTPWRRRLSQLRQARYLLTVGFTSAKICLHPQSLSWGSSLIHGIMVQNSLVLRHLIILFLTSSGMSKWASEGTNERKGAREQGERVNERTEQYLRPDPWWMVASVSASL